MFRKMIIKTFVLFIFTTSSLLALDVDVSTTKIEQTLSIQQMRIVTFNMKQTVNFTMKYQIEDTTEIPSSSIIKDSVIAFFTSYENKRDFWELINENLVANLITNFPALTSVESEIQVQPGKTFPYLRSTTFQYYKEGVQSSFNFKYKNQKKIETIFPNAVLDISYIYCDNIPQTDYLDFVDFINALDKFLLSAEMDPQSWPVTKKLLIEYLLEKFSMLSDIQISIIME